MTWAIVRLLRTVSGVRDAGIGVVKHALDREDRASERGVRRDFSPSIMIAQEAFTAADEVLPADASVDVEPAEELRRSVVATSDPTQMTFCGHDCLMTNPASRGDAFAEWWACRGSSRKA